MPEAFSLLKRKNNSHKPVNSFICYPFSTRTQQLIGKFYSLPGNLAMVESKQWLWWCYQQPHSHVSEFKTLSLFLLGTPFLELFPWDNQFIQEPPRNQGSTKKSRGKEQNVTWRAGETLRRQNGETKQIENLQLKDLSCLNQKCSFLQIIERAAEGAKHIRKKCHRITLQHRFKEITPQ